MAELQFFCYRNLFMKSLWHDYMKIEKEEKKNLMQNWFNRQAITFQTYFCKTRRGHIFQETHHKTRWGHIFQETHQTQPQFGSLSKPLRDGGVSNRLPAMSYQTHHNNNLLPN